MGCCPLGCKSIVDSDRYRPDQLFSAERKAAMALDNHWQVVRYIGVFPGFRRLRLLYQARLEYSQNLRRPRRLHYLYDLDLHRQLYPADWGRNRHRGKRIVECGSGCLMRVELDSAVARRAGRQKRWNRPVAWILLFSSFVLRAAAQEAQPDTYAGFEGNNVAGVDISAKPTFDVEAFRPLIQQKAGQPFSMKAICDSVETLQKTELFSKVQVSIKPEQAGFNILFILEPASYIGILKFPGATKTFSYTQLLQA